MWGSSSTSAILLIRELWGRTPICGSGRFMGRLIGVRPQSRAFAMFPPPFFAALPRSRNSAATAPARNGTAPIGGAQGAGNGDGRHWGGTGLQGRDHGLGRAGGEGVAERHRRGRG